jgi:hypothetical protein
VLCDYHTIGGTKFSYKSWGASTRHSDAILHILFIALFYSSDSTKTPEFVSPAQSFNHQPNGVRDFLFATLHDYIFHAEDPLITFLGQNT